MRNIDGSMEEAAMNLGARGWRLFRRVVFPLAMPGFVAGAALVFVKVFDDLGTPLVLGVTNMLAPQAYLRITSVGIDDPQGYVVSVIMVAFSIFALWLAARMTQGRDYATLQKGGGALRAAPAARLGGAAGLRLDRAGAAGRAGAAPGHPADVLRAGLELLGAARRLHAGPLRQRVRQLRRHGREHAASTACWPPAWTCCWAWLSPG
ncbi:MAG: ABC transporter permease subunit [Pseudorhodoferax sp.]